jgi:hypothetical protein
MEQEKKLGNKRVKSYFVPTNEIENIKKLIEEEKKTEEKVEEIPKEEKEGEEDGKIRSFSIKGRITIREEKENQLRAQIVTSMLRCESLNSTRTFMVFKIKK